MIGYVTLGTNDFDKACAFYDTLMAAMDAKRTWEMESFVVWGTGPEQPSLCVTKPYDGNAATVGNGVMVALQMPSREAVDRVYAKALAAGGTDEGAPGVRGDEAMGFYAGYFRDLDGNKLNAFCIGAG